VPKSTDVHVDQRLWRELRRGTGIERPPAWLYRTVYRLAMQQHRWRHRVSLILPRLAPHRTDCAGPETSDRLTVWAAVDGLPPRQRHVLYLHYDADLTFDQIAGIVGISPSAARTHASRGIATLRGRLSTLIGTLMASRHATHRDSNVLNRPRLGRLTPESRASGMRYQHSFC
jgi:RNA polymerase sigma factor (sigma-70 family)